MSGQQLRDPIGGRDRDRGKDTAELERRFACELNLEQSSARGRLEVPLGGRNPNDDASKAPRRASLIDFGRTTPIELFRSQQNSTGTLSFPDGKESCKFSSRDLLDQGEIGKGAFATVNRMLHACSTKSMAVKRVRCTMEESEQKQVLTDLNNVVRSSSTCPFLVRFFGALFWEGDCWICMELMDVSLDKFYKFVFRVLRDRLPDFFLANIASSTVNALNYLKEQLKMMHRDVKPSNILLDRRGNIKLADYGICCALVDNIAKTRDAGCRPYMAPERIDPSHVCDGYDIRSDIWSVGITMVEISTGKFPYPKWNCVFEQLDQLLHGEAPTLSAEESFSPELIDFVKSCLVKDVAKRADCAQLMKHALVEKANSTATEVATYVTGTLNRITDQSQLEFDAVDSA